MRIQVAKPQQQTRIFGLICGRAGTGKTYQLTTLPRKESLLVSMEKGHLTIMGSGYAFCEPTSYSELVNFLRNFDRDFGPKGLKYLYIDSLTEIYDLIKAEAKSQFTTKQNYAKHDYIQEQLMTLLRIARNMEASVFFTCHTKTVQDGMDHAEDLAFDGKLPAMVMKQFDFSFHLVDEDEEGILRRYILTSPGISRCAKARVSEFMNVKLANKEEANLYLLIKKLLGGTNEA